ncbi:5276_t:CDS:2 [Gigaspora margarita]|uniref:5276_t:CDS:1 n=1 Tax=Gigaspora margarita TaxID=4874 RepID=A0ABN7UVD8_GIGMA|nr:5276_t:CDS:2 [Gigaspora margarita]
MNIYKGNSLLQQKRQTLLQSYPRNKNIKFKPLPIDKQIISRISKQVYNTDKVLSKLAYKFSLSLHLLDLVIKYVYETKPQDKDQDDLALIIVHRDEVLKLFIPNYQPTPESELVFGEELQEIIEKRNREAKFFNNALYQRK